METRLTLWLRQLSKIFIYLAIFLIPLFFLPVTFEKLEFNKYFLLYALTLLSLLCFLLRAVIIKNFELRRTPLDLPALILWGAFLASSLFSSDRYLSFFGDFGFLGISFVGISILVVFYFLLIQHLTSVSEALKAVYVLLASGALAAVAFLLHVSKALNWSALAQLPTANLTHTSNLAFGVFLTVVFLLALALLSMKKHNWALDGFTLGVALLSVAVFVLIGFKTVWIVLTVGLFLLLVFFLTHADEVRHVWLSVAFGLFVAALLITFLGSPRFLSTNLPVEVSLSSPLSWTIAVDTLTDSVKQFLFGTGPATFGYDFSRFRPENINATFAWNIRFNQSFSSALEWLTTLGLLPSLALLGVLLMVLGLIVATWLNHLGELRRKKKVSVEETEMGAATFVPQFHSSPLLFWALAGGWLTLTSAFLLTSFGAVHWMAWWLITALLVVASAQVGRTPVATTPVSLKTIPQYILVTSFGCILLFTAIVVLGVYLGRFFVAEVTFVRSLGRPLPEKISALQQAIGLNSHRPLFRLTLADAFFTQAKQLSDDKGDPQQVIQLAAMAVQTAKAATDSAPRNVAAWEFLATMYANARGVAPEANSWLIGTLNKAIELEPTNPLFYFALGNAKLTDGRPADAVKDFERAVSLKSDFTLAYMRLALSKELLKDLNGAIAALEKGLPSAQQNAEYFFQLGRYYFNRNKPGDFQLAEIAFRRAIGLNQNYADALFGLALLYEATGNKAPALELYQRVLELNPGNKEVERHLKSLSPAPPSPPAEEKSGAKAGR